MSKRQSYLHNNEGIHEARNRPEFYDFMGLYIYYFQNDFCYINSNIMIGVTPSDTGSVVKYKFN